jgi:regulator of sigma E protease
MDLFFAMIHTAASYVVPFLALTLVIVFVHEMGHFLTARYYGVTVEAFSIGFGKELMFWHDRYGTRWRIALVPLGGYVKFAGDADPSSRPDPDAVLPPDANSLLMQPLSARAAIVAAGPIANLLLSIVLLSGVAFFSGSQHLLPVVDQVIVGQPADLAGLRNGDQILAIDGEPVEDFADVQSIIAANPEKPLTLTIERNGAELMLSVTPVAVARDGLLSMFPVGRIGIRMTASSDHVKTVEYGPIEAFSYGLRQTYVMSMANLKGIGSMIVGGGSINDVAGPLTIADLSKKTAEAGIVPFLRWIAGISVAIGIVNLLPIPILDGGHLLFYGLEAVRRKPVEEKIMALCYRFGLIIVLSLMGLGILSDVWRSFKG